MVDSLTNKRGQYVTVFNR